MLRINNMEATYNDVVLAVKGVSFEVSEGRITALLGSNGAGKTTILNLISGLTKTKNLRIEKGDIEFQGEIISQNPPHKIVGRGIIQIPEGRRIFKELSVRENLIAGGFTRSGIKELKHDIEKILSYFPPLAQRINHHAGYLSGGEQQMLAIGRALMSRPKLLLMDEPSLGLAPLIAESIFNIIKKINQQEGTTILLVEQNANIALNISSSGYIMENGKIVLDGTSEKLLENDDVKEFYLGLSEMGTRKNYRQVKHYKRRKRWLT